MDGLPDVLDPALLDAPRRRRRDDDAGAARVRRVPARLQGPLADARPAHRQAVVPGGNGVFQSTIVRGGRVVGTWKRTIGRARVSVSVRQLTPFDDTVRGGVEAALTRYADFLGLPLHHSW